MFKLVFLNFVVGEGVTMDTLIFTYFMYIWKDKTL
jgi:hypothetical protein